MNKQNRDFNLQPDDTTEFKNPNSGRVKKINTSKLKESLGVDGKVSKGGDSMSGDLNMESSSINFFRPDGSRAGIVTADEPDNFGFGIAGIDSEENLTNVVLAGSNIYLGDFNQYLSNNGALPYGYIKLGGEPVQDPQGRDFYPLQFQQIEQELYSETYTDTSSYNISSGNEVVVLTTPALSNMYEDPASYEYSFRLQEQGNRSTEIDYWFRVNGIDGTKNTTTVGSDTIVTVNGGNQIQTSIGAGQVLELVVQARQTGQGRTTLIRGDETPTKVTLRQLGFGVFSASTVSLFPIDPAVNIVPTTYGAIIYVDPSFGNVIKVLPSASLFQEKEFVIKRIVNGSNYISIEPAAGEFIDSISSSSALVMGLSGDSVRLRSDGVMWHILDRKTSAWGSISYQGSSTNQSVTTSWQKLNVFNTDLYQTAGRVTPDSANDKITVERVELAQDGYKIYFNISFEFSNNVDIDFCVYVGGVATSICNTVAGRGNRAIGTTIAAPISVSPPEPKDIEIYVRADSNGTLTALEANLSIERIGG